MTDLTISLNRRWNSGTVPGKDSQSLSHNGKYCTNFSITLTILSITSSVRGSIILCRCCGKILIMNEGIHSVPAVCEEACAPPHLQVGPTTPPTSLSHTREDTPRKGEEERCCVRVSTDPDQFQITLYTILSIEIKACLLAIQPPST